MGKKNTFLILFISLFLAGCWGQRDIEERGFVIGTAIDMEEEQQSENFQIRMTNQTVVPPMLSSSGGQGSSQGNATKNITGTGNSMLITSANIDTMSARVPFYEHLKLIVVSEEVVSVPGLFPSLMDYFLREGEMRREIKLVISKGNADSIMEVEPEGELLPIVYIDSTFENTDQTLQILNAIRIGDLQKFFLGKNSYAIPMIRPLENHVHIEGAAVFRSDNDTMVGTLDRDEVKGLNLIKGDQEGGVIDFYMRDRQMNLRMTDLSSSIKTNTDDLENIKISVNIEIQGYIDEMFGSRSLLDEKYFGEMEKNIEERVEELAMKAIDKGQNDLQIDFFGFSKNLHANHYNQWKKIEDDWDRGDKLFTDSTIDISTNVNIRSIGATDKVKVKRKEG